MRINGQHKLSTLNSDSAVRPATCAGFFVQERPMQIHWYPGHMAKAKRELSDQLKRVDLVVELCDARLPRSSRNPDLIRLAGGKKRLLALGKADLADEAATRRWVESLRKQGNAALAVDSAHVKAKEIINKMESMVKEDVERMRARGVKKTVRAMVVGIPNVGKSTFINRLRGERIAAVADRPGVTRANRWVKISPYLELMDTPGMLWPKLEDQSAAEKLAWLGTIRDELLDIEKLAISLLEALLAIQPDAVARRFKLFGAESSGGTHPGAKLSGEPLLEAVCFGRGFLLPGGLPDTRRAAAVSLDEFRAGKICRVTLED